MQATPGERSNTPMPDAPCRQFTPTASAACTPAPRTAATTSAPACSCTVSAPAVHQQCPPLLLLGFMLPKALSITAPELAGLLVL